MNMDDYILLDRHFSLSSEDDSDEVSDIVFSQLGLGKQKTWSDLLLEYRSVILAEAGTGKTEEFKHRVDLPTT